MPAADANAVDANTDANAFPITMLMRCQNIMLCTSNNLFN